MGLYCFIILFPGGYFNSGKREAKTIYNAVFKQIREHLQLIDRDIVVCVGIDGRMGRYYPKDQLALAIRKKGIVAIGRKFHPTDDEEGVIEEAQNHKSLESGNSRYFLFKERRFYLAVCNDIFGIREKGLKNPDIDIVLNAVHQFTPRGEEGSGDVYFARWGFAGASKQWECPVFGSAVFFKRNIPPKWPSGVLWNQGKKDIKIWKYCNNPLVPKRTLRPIKIKEGIASVRIYSLSPNT
jgi:hypothetical protein